MSLPLKSYGVMVDAKCAASLPAFQHLLAGDGPATADSETVRRLTRHFSEPALGAHVPPCDGIAHLECLLKMETQQAMAHLQGVARAVLAANDSSAVVAAASTVSVSFAKSCFGHQPGRRVAVCLASAPVDNVLTGEGSYERVVRAILHAGGEKRGCVGVCVVRLTLLLRLRACGVGSDVAM